MNQDLVVFFSVNNLPKIKGRVSFIILDDKKSKGTHWVSLFIDRNTAMYFHSFGINYLLQEVLNKINNKSITNNIFRIQSDNSVMCGFYFITFIE